MCVVCVRGGDAYVQKQDEDSAELYLCLFKTMSYLHARRLTAAEVVQYGGPQGRRRLIDFVAKNTPLYDGKDTDVVCDDFTRVDRVLAVRDAVDGSGRLGTHTSTNIHTLSLTDTRCLDMRVQRCW